MHACTVCMNPKARKSDPMCLSVKLCTLITCLQSFYFTRSHHITGTIRFIFMLEGQLYTCKKHYIFSSNCWIAAMLLQGITYLFYSALQPHCVLQIPFSTIPLLSPKKPAIKEEKSFIRAVGSRGYIALGCCWPECLTLGYCPAVRSLQLCLGSQSWILPLRFECLFTPISKVLTATIYWWYTQK